MTGPHPHAVISVWLIDPHGDQVERLTLGQACLTGDDNTGGAIITALRQVADRMDTARAFRDITRALEDP